jgi:hypothetical protein
MLTVERLFEIHKELNDQGVAIMEAKNHDYRGGTGDPLANFRDSEGLGVNPIVGIMLRMRDKMARVKTFVEKGTLLVKGESVRDSLIDIRNYAVLIAGFVDEIENERAEKLIEKLQAPSRLEPGHDYRSGMPEHPLVIVDPDGTYRPITDLGKD